MTTSLLSSLLVMMVITGVMLVFIHVTGRVVKAIKPTIVYLRERMDKLCGF